MHVCVHELGITPGFQSDLTNLTSVPRNTQWFCSKETELAEENGTLFSFLQSAQGNYK